MWCISCPPLPPVRRWRSARWRTTSSHGWPAAPLWSGGNFLSDQFRYTVVLYHTLDQQQSHQFSKLKHPNIQGAVKVKMAKLCHMIYSMAMTNVFNSISQSLNCLHLAMNFCMHSARYAEYAQTCPNR